MNEAIKCEDLEFTIYVEDTDFQGFVYYANYLKFFERARSKFLDDNQISQKKLKELNHTFIVKNVNIEYLKPAELGDQIIVQSKVEKKSDARYALLARQKMMQNKESPQKSTNQE